MYSTRLKRAVAGLGALGAVLAISGLQAQPASASAVCLSWIDTPYLNDDTGASGYTSTCAIEAWEGGGADGSADGSDGDGSGTTAPASAVHVTAPPRTLDPECKTAVSSLIDVFMPFGYHAAYGLPAGASTANPTVVVVTLDPNLFTGPYAGQPWMQMAAVSLGQWQYQLNAAGVPLKMVLDPTPMSGDEAQSAMWGALTAGDRLYQWHVGGLRAGTTLPDITAANTEQRWGDGTGHSLYVDTVINSKTLPKLAASDLTTILSHEFGHALGLAHTIADATPNSVMPDAHGDGASQPTCSDAKAVARAMSQSTTTGYTPTDDHL